MATLSGSFRLPEFNASGLAPRRTSTSSVLMGVSPTESIANFANAAMRAVPAIDSVPTLPGLGTAVRLAEALKRSATPTRTAEEELEEEHINAITHGVGLVLSMAGFAYLLSSAMAAGGWVRLASCGVYGVSLMLMYAASTSLHAAQSPELKLRFQVVDHVSIYLLIAGTYTPFLAFLLQGRMGWTLLGCVWVLAAIGISIKVRYAGRLEETSPLPYVGLGWLVVAALKPLMAALPPVGVGLLIAGGVSYSTGVIFFCRDDKRYFHAIWHLFVMVGTACHFYAILFYVAA